MRRKILPFILGGALSIAAVAPAAAAPNNTSVTNALIGLTVQAADVLNNSLNDVVEINISDSFNNLLQNALQNAEILNDLEVTIQNVLNNLNINVSDIEIEVLENGNIVITVLGGTEIDTITLS